MRVGWIGPLAVALAACSFLPQHSSGSDGSVGDGDHDIVADGAVDAAIDASPCQECAAAGGTCNGSACDITVTGGSATCPPDLSCSITCSGSAACNGVIDCSHATACTIDCKSDGTCDGTIVCTGVACAVHCNGDNTCDNGTIDDGSGGSCSIACCGNNTCDSEGASQTSCTDNNSSCG